MKTIPQSNQLTPNQNLRRQMLVGILLTSALSACATGRPTMNYVNHAFAFDARIDSPDEEILAYSYGQDRGRGVVNTNSDTAIRQFGRSPQVTGIHGDMPVGDSLYVKWRVKSSNEVFEDTVDLKPLLPKAMEDKRIYFVVRGKRLLVYLTDLKIPRPDSSPIVGNFKSQMFLTRQIYPS